MIQRGDNDIISILTLVMQETGGFTYPPVRSDLEGLFHVVIHQGKGLEQFWFFFKSCTFFLILLGRKSNKSPSLFGLLPLSHTLALVHDTSVLINLTSVTIAIFSCTENSSF